MKQCDLSDVGIIKVQGPDAGTFLQGQLTCDVLAVTPEQTCLAALCNPKGRIIASFRLWCDEHAYFMLLPKDNLPHALATLQKYAIFSKLTLEDISANWQVYGVTANTDLGVNRVTQQDDGFQIRAPGQESRYYLITQSTQSTNTDPEQWQLADIQTGIPSIHSATSELVTPHDISLPQLGAVSFDKGCYVGQEIIARMQHLGKPKKQLFYAQCNTTELLPALATKITADDKNVGLLINAIIIDDCCHLLASINTAATKEQTLQLENNVLKQVATLF